MKYYFSWNIKTLVNENLTFKNVMLSFHERKTKREGHIFYSYTRNDVVFLQNTDRPKPIIVQNLIV